ncbi:Alpha/Beta hydrolase protein [Naematelia encephala]|uniref:Alpha/Beta hydrolase protein n=1 Tax=Naematelia encephala TaxID=71784 RepID=A0A1Y2B4R5_9TREE|nr:Alpha/Beta hydrolase protein [Naematelia encephala]
MSHTIPSSQQVLVESTIEQFAAGSTVQAQIATAHNTSVSGTYSLYFEYCEPKTATPAGIFQTHHGLVGNAAYWNVQLDNKTDNSFAESAAAAGWSTLSYDRLGVGNSSHPNGLTTVQINYEIAQSIGIAQALRNGYLSDLGKWSKVVGVGHSYGSNLLTGVAAINPGVFDALVLTGFTNNATQGPLGLAGFSSTIASVAYPSRFSSLGNDYVITPSVSADQLGFFHYPNYTQSALELFTTTKSEYSLGQQNSIAGPLKLNRSNYTNPTLVVTGANDAPYCAADCSVTSLGGNKTQLDTARTLYPGVADSAFETFVVPATGHGINYHETAYAAYQEIIAFIKRQNV